MGPPHLGAEEVERRGEEKGKEGWKEGSGQGSGEASGSQDQLLTSHTDPSLFGTRITRGIQEWLTVRSRLDDPFV